MNIYADRGNLLLLERRCAWRGLGFELSGAGLGEALDPGAHDLFYLGGGQDRDQALCAQDLGNVAIQLDGGEVLAGFENHGGRTRLGPGAAPLGRVLQGHGNDGRSGYEGVRGGAHGTVLGTYLHGPLLPKNAWFADWLTATALHRAVSDLEPLDDRLEHAAHAAARRAAGI